MTRIIIVSCKRIRDVACVSCIKCFKAMQERQGEFARYPQGEELDLVALGDCGDCPGLVLPKVSLIFDIAKAWERDFTVIHFGTCIVKAVTTAACPIDLKSAAERLAANFGKEVVLGTHPW